MLSEPTAPATIPRLPWDEFLHGFAWRQGEHVTLIGPTGAGKTTLALALLPLRRYVLALATKPKDRTMDKLVRSRSWRLVRTWDNMPNVLGSACRVVFWPRYRTPDDEPAQAVEIARAMNGAFAQGGWCLFVDELWWVERKLGLSRMVESWFTQGRSVGLSMIVGSQRPAHISLLAYDQATHVFFWRENDEANLKRIAGLNGLKSRIVRETVATLPKHAVLYVNTNTGAMIVTQAPAP